MKCLTLLLTVSLSALGLSQVPEPLPWTVPPPRPGFGTAIVPRGTATDTLTPVPATPSIDHFLRAIVSVSGPEGEGSGVLFQDRNNTIWVWTVAHVIEDAEVGDIVTIRPFDRRPLPARVVAFDDGEDIALLQVTADLPGVTFIRWNRSAQVTVGSEIVVVGCPYGSHIVYNSAWTGILAFQGREVRGVSYDQASCGGIPGVSGGGVFHRESRALLGLIALRSRDSDSISLYVPSWRVERFARSRGFVMAFTHDDLPR